MKRLFKVKNEKYPYQSKTIKLLHIWKLTIDMNENYTPHYLDVNIWWQFKGDAFSTLINWFKIPLDSYARKIFRLDKYTTKVMQIKGELKQMEIEKAEEVKDI